MDEPTTHDGHGSLATSRRKALLRLGLTAAVAYSAPTLVRVDRTANAQILPTPCRPPGQVGSPSGGPSPGNPVHCPPGHTGSPSGGPPGNSPWPAPPGHRD